MSKAAATLVTVPPLLSAHFSQQKHSLREPLLVFADQDNFIILAINCITQHAKKLR